MKAIMKFVVQKASPVLLILFLLACSDMDTTTNPSNSPSSDESLSTTYWENNSLEVVDEAGQIWRFERNGDMPTEAELYKNDMLIGTLSLSYDSGEVDQLTFAESATSAWIQTDPSGTITGTIVDGSMCPPSDRDCVEPTLFFDCTEEFESMQSAAWRAAGTGAVAGILTIAAGPTNPVTIGSVIIATGRTGEALGRLG
jgi:hypothetical protein